MSVDLTQPHWKCRCGVVAMPLTDNTTCDCGDIYEQEWTLIHTSYDLGNFPPNDDLYCPQCGGAKKRSGAEWHAWDCARNAQRVGVLEVV
jgi:hypothetical protein